MNISETTGDGAIVTIKRQ